MSDALADPGPSFPIVGRAMDSARNGHMRIALRSRKKVPANGGECGYVDGYAAGEDGGYIFGNFHLRPGKPVVGRAKYGFPAGACEKCFTNCGKRCEDRKSTRLNSSHLGISYAVF